MSKKKEKPVKVNLAGQMVDINDMCLEDLMAFCAWNDGTERDLLWQFLEKEGLVSKADEFLAERAREEIREGQ
jgi:hypothetical protein